MAASRLYSTLLTLHLCLLAAIAAAWAVNSGTCPATCDADTCLAPYAGEAGDPGASSQPWPHTVQLGSDSAHSADISCGAVQNTTGTEDCGTQGKAVAERELWAAATSVRCPAASCQYGPRPAEEESGTGHAAGVSGSGGVPNPASKAIYRISDGLDDTETKDELTDADSSTVQPGSGIARAAGGSGVNAFHAADDDAADEDDDFLADDSGDEAEAEEELEGADRDHSNFLTDTEWRARPDNATLQARGEAAAMGAFLADAATVGLHEVQHPAEVARLLVERDEEGMPEFFHPPANPGYQVAQGEQSAYAYEVLPLLHTLMAIGRFLPGRFADDALQFFSGTKGHVNAGPRAWLARWLGADAPPEDRQGTGRASAGVPGDERANALIKVPLLVGRYAATGQLEAAVEAAVRVQQDSDAAVAAALAFAALLERIIVAGDSLQSAVEWAATAGALPPAGRAAATDVLALQAINHTEAVGGWGRSDNAAQALRGGLHAALTAGGSYRAGVRAGIRASGDSCSRAHVTGALLAAAGGEGALPKAWRRKAARYLDIKQMVHVVVLQRTTFVPFLIDRSGAGPAPGPAAAA